MKTFIKKSLALLLVLAMLPVVPMMAFAEDATEETAKTVYDFGEAFAVDMTRYSFEGATAENTTVYQNLPLKNANSETSASPWKVGYFSVKDNNTFTCFDYVSRGWYTTDRAPEDTVSPQSWATNLVFGVGTAYKGPAGSIYGYQISGYKIGYAFGNHTNFNSHSGALYGTYENTRNAVRFVAPKDGIVIPEVKLCDDNVTEFTEDNDGVLFKIYKQSGNTQTAIIGGNYTAKMDNSEGWERIPYGKQLTTYTGDALEISKGDEIVLVFDPYNTTSADEFCIHSYQIKYVEPVVAYDTNTFLSYRQGKQNVVDLTRSPITSTLDGTIAYSLSDPNGLLKKTDIPGFYTLTGVTNYDGETLGTPAVLTASYTPKGSSTPTCTTSTNLYIGSVKTSYDMGEGFAVQADYDFSTAGQENNTVYQNLVPYLKSDNSETSASPWKYGRYELNNSNHFTCSPYLSVGWYTQGRAPEDMVSPASYPLRLSFGTGSTYKGPSGGVYGYQIAGTTVGYAFGANTEYNSFSGNTGSKFRNAVRFVAPRSGVVSPNVQLVQTTATSFDDTNDGILFKVYKKSSSGATTAIYGGDFTSPMDQSYGWERIPCGANVATWKDAGVSVAKGDEIVLIFDPNSNTSNDYFTIYSYTIDYLTPISEYAAETYAYYEKGKKNQVDLTLKKVSDTDGGTIVYTVLDTDGCLQETSTPGVYAMTGVLNYEDEVKGTPVTVVASYYAEGESAEKGAVPTYTTSTRLYIGEIVNTYDFGDAFAIKPYTFTAGNAVADYNAIETKYENSETSSFPWKIGYITVSDGKFNYCTAFNRYGASDRVLDDTVNATYTPRVGWGKAQDTANGKLSGSAYFGYSYKSDTAYGTYWNSFSGNHNTKERPTLRFVVPRDGVINPVLKLSDNVDTEYSGSDGVLFRVYKTSGGKTTTIYGGDFTAKMDNSTGWARIPGGNVLTTWDQAKVAVKAGDEIVLQFDPYEYHWSDEYNFHSYVLTYLEPIQNYTAVTYATYDSEAADRSLDMRVEKYVTDGSIEYTKNDPISALTETQTPGIYTLAGSTNYNVGTLSTPVTVTAAYYAEGESSANGDEPVCTTTTSLYISSVLANYEPFAYDRVKTTGLDMAYDTFFLPYYADSYEREQYGTIDLGLNSRWSGATVTFDKNGYLEYVGAGKIRAIGLYDQTASGAGAVDSTDTTVIGSGATVKARRDKNTVGTPIKMTVTAPDGYQRTYYVMTFKAAVSDLVNDGHDVYRWLYGSYRNNCNVINNAVMSFETIHVNGENYSFKPMVPDTGNFTSANMISIDVAGNKYVDARSAGMTTIYGLRSVSTLGEVYDKTNFGLYVDSVGIAQTFTAPKTGTVELTSFLPNLFISWQSEYMGELPATLSVNLYDSKDQLLDTLYTESWGPKKRNGSLSGAWDFYGDAKYSNRVTGSRLEEKLTFAVLKGQKVRVMIQFPDISTLSSGKGAFDLNRSCDPIFTYIESELSGTITATGTERVTTSAQAKIAPVLKNSVYAYFGYDDDGKLVGSGYGNLEKGKGDITPSITANRAATWFKVFVWEDLTNMKSVGGTLILR